MSAANVGISYNIVNIDTANEWNSVNNEYTVFYNGTYVISLSTGAYPNAHYIVQIWENNVHLASNKFYDKSHVNIDVISRTIVTTLKVGDCLDTQFGTMAEYFFFALQWYSLLADYTTELF